MSRPLREQPRRALPEGRLRGNFLVAEAAWQAAERLLPTYRGPDGDHEGIVFLFGRRLDSVTLITTSVAPDAEHGSRGVLCREEHVLAAVRAARESGVALVAQLHSHPGAWTEHSEGDDSLVLMPYEGMLSFVAPRYGHFGLRPVHSLGVHQFQDGRWVLAAPQSVKEALSLVPSELDLR
jgi:hypothetical protein